MPSYEIIFNFLSSQDIQDLMERIPYATWEVHPLHSGCRIGKLNDDSFVAGLKIHSNNFLGTLNSDFHILEIGLGGSVSDHLDSQSTSSRLNALISPAPFGGDFYLQNRYIGLYAGDAIIYRADQLYHRVSLIKKGVHYIWSVGL